MCVCVCVCVSEAEVADLSGRQAGLPQREGLCRGLVSGAHPNRHIHTPAPHGSMCCVYVYTYCSLSQSVSGRVHFEYLELCQLSVIAGGGLVVTNLVGHMKALLIGRSLLAS